MFTLPVFSLAPLTHRAPTEGSHFDKKHKLARRLAKLLFPEDKAPYKAYRNMLGPLRSEIKIVERFMCEGK